MALTESLIQQTIEAALEKLKDSLASVGVLGDKVEAGVVLNAARLMPSDPQYPSVLVMIAISTNHSAVDGLKKRFDAW